MKVYELKLQKGGKGVFKVSLVKDPAIESTLLKFSEEKPPILTMANEEKRIIYSVAMRPNIEIFRKDVNGEPAKVFYTAETVEEAQINYFRNNGNKATNINHADENTDGVFLFESWIVKDPELDKSKSLGLETFAGDLVQGYKIDNEEIWSDVKEGKLDGLSIEATNLEHIFKNNIEMSTEKKNEKSSIDKIFDFIFNMKKESEKMAEDIPKEEEEKKPVEEQAEEVPVEEEKKPTEEQAEEVPVEVPAEPTEKEKVLMDEIISLKQTIAELEAEKVKDDTELETMKAQVIEMKKQTPGAVSIPAGPAIVKHEAEKKYEDMTNFEKTKFNRE